jgi:regulatory protein
MTYCPRPSISEKREEQARALCLRLLTAKARTRSELAGQLKKRGYPDDVSGRVLDRLADVGLVDDLGFAEQWIQSRQANGAKGKRALATDLRKKGVQDAVIAEALDGIDASAEQDRAVKLVQTRLRRENLDGDQAKVARRLAGMLARRGYSETVCFDVVRTQLALELERRRT